MDISIFDVIGPVMIGPSSSHTAGAAKLSNVARTIVKAPFSHISFGLHGSFAHTYIGHGTDKALVAGALGLSEQDENLSRSFELAKEAGLTFDFYETELIGMHENTVKMTLTMMDGTKNVVVGSSIGGGQIIIKQINGFDTEVNLYSPTIIIYHKDKKGVLSEVTKIIAKFDLNIATMKLSRKKKGDSAFCVIDLDDPIPDTLEEELAKIASIESISIIN